MTDDDLTPPPDEALPEQSRARIRAELLAAAQDGRIAGRSPWLVPLVAAAAVLAVVGVGAWVVQVGGDESGSAAVVPTPSATAPDPEPSEPSGKATLSLFDLRRPGRPHAGRRSAGGDVPG